MGDGDVLIGASAFTGAKRGKSHRWLNLVNPTHSTLHALDKHRL